MTKEFTFLVCEGCAKKANELMEQHYRKQRGEWAQELDKAMDIDISDSVTVAFARAKVRKVASEIRGDDK